jgi:hypothetical protein
MQQPSKSSVSTCRFPTPTHGLKITWYKKRRIINIIIIIIIRRVENFHNEELHNIYIYIYIYIYISLALQPPWALAHAFSFMIILQTVGLLGRVISSSQGPYLGTGQYKHRINTYTHQTCMPCVGFKPMIPTSERAKTVHALDCAATVTGFTI